MAARKYSVGIGPVPVPPALSGSSTRRSNPAAVTRHRHPGLQLLGRYQAALADQPLQGPQPAPVIAPVVLRRVACLPGSDLGDQALPEVLPVDPPGLLQRQREAEGLALPRRGEDQLAVIPGRSRRAGRVEQVAGVRTAAGIAHGAPATATPTMASLVTRAASSSSDICSVPAGRSGSTM